MPVPTLTTTNNGDVSYHTATEVKSHITVRDEATGGGGLEGAVAPTC